MIVIELPYRISGNLSGTVSGTVSVTVTGLPHGSAENRTRRSGGLSNQIRCSSLPAFFPYFLLLFSVIFSIHFPLFRSVSSGEKKHTPYIIAHSFKHKSLCMTLKHNLSCHGESGPHQKGCVDAAPPSSVCRAFGSITDPNRQINPRRSRGCARTCSIRTRIPLGQA